MATKLETARGELLGAARWAAVKLESMYERGECSPRWELDQLIRAARAYREAGREETEQLEGATQAPGLGAALLVHPPIPPADLPAAFLRAYLDWSGGAGAGVFEEALRAAGLLCWSTPSGKREVTEKGRALLEGHRDGAAAPQSQWTFEAIDQAFRDERDEVVSTSTQPGPIEGRARAIASEAFAHARHVPGGEPLPESESRTYGEGKAGQILVALARVEGLLERLVAVTEKPPQERDAARAREHDLYEIDGLRGAWEKTDDPGVYCRQDDGQLVDIRSSRARRVTAYKPPHPVPTIGAPCAPGMLRGRLLAAWAASGMPLGKLVVDATNAIVRGESVALPWLTDEALVEVVERYLARGKK